MGGGDVIENEQNSIQNDESNTENNVSIETDTVEENTEETIELTLEQVNKLIKSGEQKENSGLTFYGYTDHTNYLTVDVDGATLNDLYTIGLSLRNILLLFFLVFCVFKFGGMLKSCIYRALGR